MSQWNFLNFRYIPMAVATLRFEDLLDRPEALLLEVVVVEELVVRVRVGGEVLAGELGHGLARGAGPGRLGALG
jgi:hypothetical protein